MTSAYDDIIHLQHPVSKKHPQMPLMDRAAQFAPFAALTGHGNAVREVERLTDRRIELDEYEKSKLSDKFNMIVAQMNKCPKLTITYFKPDDKKQGGAYRTVTGYMKKLDEYERVVCLTDGTKIEMDEIVEIDNDLI